MEVNWEKFLFGSDEPKIFEWIFQLACTLNGFSFCRDVTNLVQCKVIFWKKTSVILMSLILLFLFLQSKLLVLTSEEKKLLEIEGVTLPTDMPLTKV